MNAAMATWLALLPLAALQAARRAPTSRPDHVTGRMVLARSAAGDVAMACLPDNEAIKIDVAGLPAALSARWFDPVHGRYGPMAEAIENQGTHGFAPPAKGDWVPFLQRKDG